MTPEQDKIAQNAYENYNFGENVIVVGDAGWESDGTSDFLKKVYVEFNDVPSESSHIVSLHVKFDYINSNKLKDVYGLLVSNGADIGTWVQSQSKD